MLKRLTTFRRNKSFRKALAYLERNRSEVRFGGAACIFLALLQRAYYSNLFKVLIYNSGQKFSAYEQFINTVFFLVGAFGVAYGKALRHVLASDAPPPLVDQAREALARLPAAGPDQPG